MAKKTKRLARRRPYATVRAKYKGCVVVPPDYWTRIVEHLGAARQLHLGSEGCSAHALGAAQLYSDIRAMRVGEVRL